MSSAERDTSHIAENYLSIGSTLWPRHYQVSFCLVTLRGKDGLLKTQRVSSTDLWSRSLVTKNTPFKVVTGYVLDYSMQCCSPSGKRALIGFVQGSFVGHILAAHHSTNATFVHVTSTFPSPGFDPSKINLSELEKEGLRKAEKFRAVGGGYHNLQITKVFDLSSRDWRGVTS